MVGDRNACVFSKAKHSLNLGQWVRVKIFINRNTIREVDQGKSFVHLNENVVYLVTIINGVDMPSYRTSA